MKHLILTLMLVSSLSAMATTKKPTTKNKIKCESMLEMFDFSISQDEPITNEQIITAIRYCDEIIEYEKIVGNMKFMLFSLDET